MADEFVDAQIENPNPDAQFVEDYSQAIDALRMDLLGKAEHSAERLVGADRIVTSGVGKMLDLLQHDNFSKQAVARNLQQTLLYAYFSDEDDLKNQVIEGLMQKPALADLLKDDHGGGVLGMITTLYSFADEPTGRDLHARLAQNIDAFHSYFSTGHALEAGSLLQTLGALRGTEDAGKFKEVLRSHVQQIGDQISPDDLRTSKRAISILSDTLTRPNNSDEEKKLYRQILFDHSDTLIQGIKKETSSFTYDVSSVLESDIPIENRISLVGQIDATMSELEPVQQKLMLRQLLHSFQRNYKELDDYDPGMKQIAMEVVKFDKNGQWNIHKV
jgi:AcrR family transcriptional regulator